MESRLRVIGYSRCSLQEQASEGLSLDAQRGRIQAWCEATGASLVRVIEDAGVSGTLPLADRTGGSQIARLLDARRPGADAVAVSRLDRLGRDAAETLAYLRRFTRGHLGLVSISDRIDLSTPQGRAMAGVGAVFSQLERELIAERTADALRILRSQGRVYGPVPFGFDAVEDRLVENQVEQRVLRRIRRLRASGKSYQRIAGALNRDHTPTKRGGPWHSMSVRSVVRTSQQSLG
jgi:DNA invertase Pin-like site-specific DNA recombinase